MTPTQSNANRILIWMCMLIAVNQLGFGAVVPVIALYARSFGVTGVSGAAPATYAAGVAPPGMNAAAISGYRMLSDLGYVIGPIALGAAADLFGADATLGVTALLLVVASLVFWRLAPESFRPSGI